MLPERVADHVDRRPLPSQLGGVGVSEAVSVHPPVDPRFGGEAGQQAADVDCQRAERKDGASGICSSKESPRGSASTRLPPRLAVGNILLVDSFRAASCVIDDRVVRRWFLSGALLGLCIFLAWPQASVGRTLVLQPTFRMSARNVVVSDATSLFTNGRYVFARLRAARSGPGREVRGLAIDDQSEARRIVRYPSGCSPAAAGGPWLAFSCQPYSGQAVQRPAKLYDFALRHWRSVPPSQALISQSEADGCFAPYCAILPVAVGRYWIEWSYDTPACMADHCEATHAFQNLATGTLASPKFDGTLVTDLDSSRLAHKLCPPLRTPDTYPQVLGAAVFVGSLEVDPIDGYIERCGSRRHYPFPYDLQPAINATVALSRTYVTEMGHGAYRLSGRLLPSLRQVGLKLPERLGPPGEILATKRYIYVLTRRGSLWYAPSPRRG